MGNNFLVRVAAFGDLTTGGATLVLWLSYGAAAVVWSPIVALVYPDKNVLKGYCAGSCCVTPAAEVAVGALKGPTAR